METIPFLSYNPKDHHHVAIAVLNIFYPLLRKLFSMKQCLDDGHNALEFQLLHDNHKSTYLLSKQDVYKKNLNGIYLLKNRTLTAYCCPVALCLANLHTLELPLPKISNKT